MHRLIMTAHVAVHHSTVQKILNTGYSMNWFGVQLQNASNRCKCSFHSSPFFCTLHDYFTNWGPGVRKFATKKHLAFNRTDWYKPVWLLLCCDYEGFLLQRVPSPIKFENLCCTLSLCVPFTVTNGSSHTLTRRQDPLLPVCDVWRQEQTDPLACPRPRHDPSDDHSHESGHGAAGFSHGGQSQGCGPVGPSTFLPLATNHLCFTAPGTFHSKPTGGAAPLLLWLCALSAAVIFFSPFSFDLSQ